MKKICFTIIAFIYISTHILYAQRDKIRFEKLSIEQGLSQSTVTCILQDRKGFMWFGTRGGLNQYNGCEFVVYKNFFSDTTSLSNNRIHDILEDKNGNLWIATSDGLNLFNRNTNKFIRYVHDDDNPYSLSYNVVNTIYEDLKGNLWIGTDLGGLNLLNKAKNSFIHYRSDNNDSTSLSNNTVRYIYEDRKGNLWIGTDDGQLNLFDQNNQNFKRFKFDNGSPNSILPIFQCILEDKDGKIWLGTLSTGLLSIESYSSGHIYYVQYVHDENDDNSLANNNIMSMYIDEADHLWIGTENNGLDIFNLKTQTFKHYKNDPNDEYSICGNSIWSLYQDPIGRIWIGTYDNGINVIDKYHEKFITYRRQSNKKNSLSHNFVSKFLEDERGNLWIATNGGGLNYFDRNTKSFIHYRHNKNDKNSLPNDAVTSLYEDIDGNLWVSTWAGGVSILDKDKKTFKHYNTANGCLRSDYVQDIIGDNNGDIFIATNDGGLNVYDSKKKHFFYYTHNESDIHSLSSNFIGKLFRDKKGRIWIGTEGNGLDLLNKNESGQISFIHYTHDPTNPSTLSNNIVETIYEDSHHNLWIGTTNGLNLMNREKGTFTVFREEDGLPSNTIHGILEDSQGNLWVSTLNGISRFNPNTITFRNYDVSDGLQGNEFNGKNAAYKSQSGEMFFGGKQGFNVFYPDSVIDNPFIPAVYLTDLKIFNKSVDIGTEGSPIHKHITEMKEITLSYKQSVFSFEFAALNYTHPEKNQYAYMMEGFDKDWNYIGTKRTATYTNLDAGKYVFKVKGSNNDGVWNEEGVSLKITITPPFWQTAWFRVMGIILVFSLLITGYKIRTARIRAHNRELGQRISERTAQLEAANKELEAFAYSVSHDLRAPLRAVDGYTKIIVEDYEQLLDEEGKRMCAVICSETKRMGQLIDDLLSFSHISYAEMQVSSINMEALVSTVFQELTTLESRERIDFRVASLPSAIGDLTLIRQVWMNLLSNAIKFSSKRERALIEVGYQQDGQRTIYSVRDNGAGFDMQYADKLFTVFWRLHNDKEFEGTGVGLAIVQRLIHRHGGEVWAESHVDQGATFYFTLEPVKQ